MPAKPDQAILLSPDRFTPLTRTPWAGESIGKLFKRHLVPGVAGTLIGESWEFSCDPSFPSTLAETNESLIDFVQRNKEAVLSKELADKGIGCQILLKLLNASSPLSVQVHPDDSDSHLKEDECGKPESWLVVHADQGAGLYIGFAKPLSKETLAKALVSGEKAQNLLQFIPVQVGDYFEIAPGVPHAIGPGVTLIEPQRILPGKSGKTYRMWDWGRKYNDKGQLDPSGKPRDLHIDEALALVDPQNQIGLEFAESTKRTPEIFESKGLKWKKFPKNRHYQVHHFESQSIDSAQFHLDCGYAVALVLEGSLEFINQESVSIKASQGQPLLIPFAALPMTIKGQGIFVLVTPAAGNLHIST